MHPGSTLRERLAPADLDYLRALPARRELTIGHRQVLVTHGSPWDEPDQYHCHYVSAGDPADIARLRAVDADVVLLGHTHIAMSLRLGRTLVLNPGSCGEARDAAHRLSFAELDFASGTASTYQICHGGPPELMLQADF
jgi:predicted phosphodiesterase